MKIHHQQSLLGDTELLIDHAALPSPILASGNSSAKAEQELKRLVVLQVKDVAHKYLSIVRRSRHSHLSLSQKACFEKAEELAGKLRRNTPFAKAQQRVTALLPLLEELLSHPQSRFYPSQSLKIDFLTNAAQLKIGSDKSQVNVHL